MKIAYLVLAHRNPKVLKKTIETLSCEESSFFIHIDKKTDINEFSEIRGRNIYFIEERIPVYWGDYSMVQAITMLIQRALNAPQDYDYLILLSGSDYPIRDKEYIHTFFERNRGVEFISITKIPGKGKPISLINTYRVSANKPIRQYIVRILARLGLAQRNYKKYLGNMEPYAGSTWWALSRDACQYILDFVNNQQSICKYYENTFACDEMLFHTIMGNSIYRSQIRRNVMYDDWTNQGAHPELIGEYNIQLFEEKENIIFSDMYGSGEMLFARKFSDNNLAVVQQIDDMIRQKRSHVID